MIATLHARVRPAEAGTIMLALGALVVMARPGAGPLLGGPVMIAGALFLASARRAGRKKGGRPERPPGVLAH